MKKSVIVPPIANGEITRSARESLRGRWLVCIGLGLALYATAFFAAFAAGAIPGVAGCIVIGVLDVVISTIGGFAYFKYCGDIADSEESPDFFGSCCKFAVSRFAVATLVKWLSGIIVFLKFLLLIIPGILALYDYAMVGCIILEKQDITVFDALKRSRRLMYGHRWQYYCFQLRFLGWAILSIFTCGIGFIWLIPYYFVAVWKFYRTLLPEEGSEQSEELAPLKPYSGMTPGWKIFIFILLVLFAAGQAELDRMRDDFVAQRKEALIQKQKPASEKEEAKESAPPHECTSWMLFPDVTGENTTILHKSRDSKARNVAVLASPAGAKRRWLGLGGYGTNSLCMGFNSSGLAGVMNGGEKCTDNNTDKSKKTTPKILVEILQNCDTASQAVDMLKDFLAKGDYYHGDQGSIFFFADTKEGYLVEFTAHFNFVQKCDTGYVIRANIWHHPGLAKYATTDFKTYLVESTREYIVRKAFNDALAKNKKVTVQDILNLSRETETPKGAINNRSLCCSWTNSTSTFVVDRDYPDVLSTAYVCVGCPRHTVQLPIPICIKELPEDLTTTKFSAKSNARWEKLKTRHPVPEAWLAFEKESFSAYNTALKQAKEAMKKGDRNQAVKVLNDSFNKIWQKVYTLPEM